MTDVVDADTVVRVMGILEKTLGVDIASPDVDLLDSGVLDSLGLIEVVAELESSFGVTIPFDSLELDDLRTAVGLARLLSVNNATPEPDEAVLGGPSVRLPGGWQIAALERDQLPEVAALLLKKSTPNAIERDRFTGLLRELFLDHPQADPDIPSLVALDDTGAVMGFIGSSTRRFDYRGSIIRMGCSGPLIVDPEARKMGLGAFLMQRYLSGPQAFSITDSATDTVLEMWTRLGGQRAEPSDRWTVVLRPMTFACCLARAKGRRGFGDWTIGVSALADKALGAVARRLLPRRPTLGSEPITPKDLCEAISALPDDIVLRPAYDEAFLSWQFDVLGRVGAGELRGALLRDEAGSVAGWYLYLLAPGGISQVLQIGVGAGRLEDVFSHLLHDADEHGAAAVDGRVEHHLQAVLGRRGVVRRRSTSHPLTHTPDPELRRVLAGPSAFRSRLDGESWMGAFGQAARAEVGAPRTG